MFYDIYLPASCGRFQDSPTFQVKATSVGELIEGISLEIAKRRLSIAGFLRVVDRANSTRQDMAFIDQVAAITRSAGADFPVLRVHCPIH